MNITWKRGSHIDESVINEVETTFGISLPDDYKKVIADNNNARPSISTFNTEVSKEHVFKKLLSLKNEDIENVYKAKKILSTVDESLFPFANDPAGNLICLKNGTVVYWLHEDDSILKVANSFTEFLSSLY